MDFITQIAASDLGTLLPQVGFGGTLLVVVVRWLNRVELIIGAIDAAAAKRAEETNHVLRGLSKALWMDLASRPYSDTFIKAEAKKMVDRIEGENRKDSDT